MALPLKPSVIWPQIGMLLNEQNRAESLNHFLKYYFFLKKSIKIIIAATPYIQDELHQKFGSLSRLMMALT